MTRWHDVIGTEKQQDYFRAAYQQVARERAQGWRIFPAAQDVFNAFRYTEFDEIKVVILGQDPYHNEHQAHGLAFSVLPGTPIPPSLANIYRELANDIAGFVIPQHGDLTAWAKQGVLLLNSVLTVRAHQPNSHKDIGWTPFTDQVIATINQKRENIVFMLWGRDAQQKGAVINKNRHLVLTAPHPSPLSAYRGFFGCHHFSQANRFLIEHGKEPINWQI